MQSAVRTGSLVRGIDVLVKNKNDIVFFVVDEAANDQSLYLTSPGGTLRKVVEVKAGVGTAVRITDDKQWTFQKEEQFWVSIPRQSRGPYGVSRSKRLERGR